MKEAGLTQIGLTQEEILKNIESLYQFVDLYSNYENAVRDYGAGCLFTMNEMHTLSSIAKNPGIFLTDLAQERHRSKSFTSQIVTKLEQDGYITKQTDEKDNKRKGLYVTEKGQALSDAHDKFDIEVIEKVNGYLLRECSPEEIRTFYKVMKVSVEVMEIAEKNQYNF